MVTRSASARRASAGPQRPEADAGAGPAAPLSGAALIPGPSASLGNSPSRRQTGGPPIFGPPKSAAGQRTVIIPAAILPDLAWHLARFAAPGDDGLLFTSSTGSPLHHSNFYRRVWTPALRQTGLFSVHFHDLRHSGNLLAAAAGATLRELMAPMGHSSTRAALIYLHDSDERQRKLAQALGDVAIAERQRRGSTGESGTDLARDDHSAS
jgi:Phage integrase family